MRPSSHALPTTSILALLRRVNLVASSLAQHFVVIQLRLLELCPLGFSTAQLTQFSVDGRSFHAPERSRT